MNIKKKLSLLSLAFSMVLSTSPAVYCQQSNDADVDHNLDRLETKFFEHTFKDSNIERIDRLEMLVFGDVRTGTPQDRVSSLVTSVKDLPELSANGAQAPAPDQASAIPPSAFTPAPVLDQLQSQSLNQSPTLEQTPAQAQTQDFSSYPQLPPPGDSTAQQIPDTSLRPTIDSPANNLLRQNMESASKVSADLSGMDKQQVKGVSKELAEMEKKAFGKTYKSDSVVVRLDRLEDKVLNQRQSYVPLQTRLERLSFAIGEAKNQADMPAVAPQAQQQAFQPPAFQPSVQSGTPLATAAPFPSSLDQSGGQPAGQIQPFTGLGSMSGSGYQDNSGYQYGGSSPNNFNPNAAVRAENGHPFLSGLGKTLLVAGSLAAVTVPMILMNNAYRRNNYGYGGGYPYGGYGGGYGMPYGGYGGGYGMPYGGGFGW
jgi:hypothetical protein